MKRKFPADKRQWVLMDWKGSLARAYGLEKNACNVLLFDAAGNLVHQHAGQEPDSDALNAIGALHDEQLAATD